MGNMGTGTEIVSPYIWMCCNNPGNHKINHLYKSCLWKNLILISCLVRIGLCLFIIKILSSYVCPKLLKMKTWSSEWDFSCQEMRALVSISRECFFIFIVLNIVYSTADSVIKFWLKNFGSYTKWNKMPTESKRFQNSNGETEAKITSMSNFQNMFL